MLVNAMRLTILVLFMFKVLVSCILRDKRSLSLCAIEWIIWFFAFESIDSKCFVDFLLDKMNTSEGKPFK